MHCTPILCLLAILLCIHLTMVDAGDPTRKRSRSRSRDANAGSVRTHGRSRSQGRNQEPSRRHSRSRSRERSSYGLSLKIADNKPGLLTRVGSNIAIAMNMPESADVEVLKEKAIKEATSYAKKAVEARYEKDKILDRLKYDDDFPCSTELWATNVVKVALAHHQVLDMLYGAIKKKHAKNMGKAASFQYRNDYVGKETEKFFEHLGDETFTAMVMMKKGINFIEDAKKHNMDLLTMFYSLAENENNYLREYFTTNILDAIYEIEDKAMDLVNSEYKQKYGPRKRKTLDPGVTSYIRQARIGAIEDTTRGRSRSRDRTDSRGYSQTGSYSRDGYTQQQSGNESRRSRSRDRY